MRATPAGVVAGFQSTISPSQANGSRPCREPAEIAISTASTACNNSVGDSQRSSGRFASSCSTILPSPAGSSGRNAASGIGSSR